MKEDDILLMFFSCVFFLNKKHCPFFLFLLALGAVEIDSFFLENKLVFFMVDFWYEIESKAHNSKYFKSAQVFTAFRFAQ